MKNTFFLFIAALFVSAAVNAQTTVDSIRSKYQLQQMPGTMTIEKTFPVLGTYQMTGANGTQSIVVTIDSVNKGIVWVEGLPEGKFKAYLKKSPGTYRIVEQKGENGKTVPDGTLLFDPATNTLNVALGKKFNDADPASVFALNTANGAVASEPVASTEVKVKSKKAGEPKAKTKLLFYTATKAEVASSTSTDAAKQ